ncbi:RecQ family ATP-dependent DNA helicase [Robiginitalea aurantiaca]|uniref:ATP-dependent DNA helicase RecQ n=1 Tax=Robiginitalea aurantiaca TaxID=3056915 RepID=A0ABT7WH12_9FLAO|nr:ATP-dependent DNA helicase RecQ [Robiginitalea aurantiaca]MDM9632204.1 ATP-dependent DNA helicase RecQ [Robiginitalea aurantiaca]
MKKTPEEVLKAHWGYDGFRGSQARIIQAVLDGSDVLALMPTGGGKSLCYQIPALVNPGVCIVISPLLALMEDQVADLKNRGIRALSLSGKLKPDDLGRLLDNVLYGKYDLLYLSPERLQQELVLSRLKELSVCLIAVDESHCISQWGFDFRPAYLKCAVLRDLHPNIPVMALTATATPKVLEDVETLLELKNPVVFKDSVHRPNLIYSVQKTEDKNYRMQQLLKNHQGSAIVYTNSRRSTVVLSEHLKQQGFSAASFHGGLPADVKSDRLKQWQSGKQKIMVATNAFGMGIDKSDVRLVIHYNVPETLEHYFQEAGRAGRDGQRAYAHVLLGPDDISRARNQFLGNLPSVADVLKTYQKLNSYLNIPYGERIETSFPFHLADFCQTYKLPINLTYNAMEILDRQGILSLSQEFWKRTRVRITTRKSELWEYFGRHPEMKETLQVLLRTYGGLFDFETLINTRLISQKLGTSERQISDRLDRMHKDGILELHQAQGDILLRFLVPREDEKTIYPFSEQIKTRRKIKEEKVAQMAAYLKNERKCRSMQLLSYFGETQKNPCGSCDVCLSQKPLDSSDLQAIEKNILMSLREGPKTSRELLENWAHPEGQTLECLQILLHKGMLILGSENQYILS